MTCRLLTPHFYVCETYKGERHYEVDVDKTHEHSCYLVHLVLERWLEDPKPLVFNLVDPGKNIVTKYSLSILTTSLCASTKKNRRTPSIPFPLSWNASPLRCRKGENYLLEDAA